MGILIDTKGLSESTVHFLVMARDKYCCQIQRVCRDEPQCTSGHALEVHHLNPDLPTELGKDEPDNLISLCGIHHRMAHGIDKNGQMPFIKKVMFDEGIRQSELGGLMDVTQSAVSQWLRSTSRKIQVAIKIKEYLQERTGKKYTLEQLFSMYEPKTPI